MSERYKETIHLAVRAESFHEELVTALEPRKMDKTGQNRPNYAKLFEFDPIWDLQVGHVPFRGLSGLKLAQEEDTNELDEALDRISSKAILLATSKGVKGVIEEYFADRQVVPLGALN